MHARLFVCLSGRPKPLASHSAVYRRHWLAVFSELIGDPRVDVFAHLDGEFHNDTQLENAATSLGVRRLVIYRNATVVHAPRPPSSLAQQTSKSWSVGSCAQPAPRPDWGGCLSAGYEQSVKWRGCWQDLLAEEQKRHMRYTFVLRIRPDVELGGRFPGLAAWRCLRHDTVWSMVSMVVPANPRTCRPEWLKRLGRLRDAEGRPTQASRQPLDRPNSYLDDSITLMPRAAAKAYFGLAHEYEQCVLPTPANSLCGPRWGWPECRVLQALARAGGPPLYREELPVAREFSIIDCNRGERLPGERPGDLRRVLGEDNASASCETPRRRKHAGVSGMWPPIWCGGADRRPRRKWCVPFCGCTEMRVANFSHLSYDAACLLKTPAGG